MRILMICPHYPPDRSGVGDYVALLASYLSDEGGSVTILTSVHAGEDSREGRSGASVLPIIDDWGWLSLPRLYALARAGRYDLVHVQYQNEMYDRSAAIAALPLLLRLCAPGTRTVVTVHDYGTPWPRRLRWRLVAGPYGKAWFLVMLLASARVILTNEQDEWRFLYQRPRYPVPTSRYTLIPIGSNLPALDGADDEAARTMDGTLRVGYFGFVNPAKGVDTLLDGFAAAFRRLPSLRLTLLCALRDDDPYHRQIQRQIDALGLRDAVTVTGELGEHEAARALASCAIVALPYRDGVSLRRTTLMAALSLGRPIISTRAKVPPRDLCDGRDLILVPPEDAPALSRAILDLAADPDCRERLGDAARAAADLFSWSAIAARTERVYRSALPRWP